jgi:hypothetical protein
MFELFSIKNVRISIFNSFLSEQQQTQRTREANMKRWPGGWLRRIDNGFAE